MDNLIPMTSFEAKMLLRDQTRKVTLETFKNVLSMMGEEVTEKSAEIIYLGHLCACGYIEDARIFIESVEDKDGLINTPHTFFTMGTVLHWALYWNKDEHGLLFFNLLTRYGALHKMNYLNEYPFEQDGNKWICLVDMGVFGKRNPLEFNMFYKFVHDKVGDIL